MANPAWSAAKAPEPPVHAPAEPSLFDECLDISCSDRSSVLLYSGEYVEAAVDLRVRGRGLDFVWARRYRSAAETGGVLGYGWDHGYNIFFTRGEDDTVLLRDGFNGVVAYHRVAGGSYEADGYHRTARLGSDGGLEVEFADGGRWILRSLGADLAPGHLERIEDRHGNALSFTYDGAGRLAQITDTLGRRYAVEHDTAGRVVRVSDFTDRVVRYEYYQSGDAGGSPGDLAHVELPEIRDAVSGAPQARRVTYTYSRGFDDETLNHNLLTSTDARGQVYLWNRYASTLDPNALAYDRLVEQALGDPDHLTQFAYEYTSGQGGTPTARSRPTTMTTARRHRPGGAVGSSRCERRHRRAGRGLTPTPTACGWRRSTAASISRFARPTPPASRPGATTMRAAT